MVWMPRARMLYPEELVCAPGGLGARRSASGRLVTPARRVSAAVMTKIEAAASARRSAFFETDVTSRFASCSRLRSTSSRVDGRSAAAQQQVASSSAGNNVQFGGRIVYSE